MTRLRNESPVEYFKELVEAAIVRQRIDAAEMTAFYLVNMLAGYLRNDRTRDDPRDSEPLAIRLARALDCGGSAQRDSLRRVGDDSLFVSGFFSDSLNRKTVDLDYYIALGGYAYGSLSRREAGSFSAVFAELATKFIAFVDVLSEVSERSALTSDTDVLRLYEKWVRTGSRRNGELLAERGIVPNSSAGTRFLQ